MAAAKKGKRVRVTVHVRELRERRGWSQVELARRSGVAQANISRIEAGVVEPDLSTLGALATALAVPLAMLLELEGDA